MHLEGALAVGSFTLEVARLAAVVAWSCSFLIWSSAFSGTVIVLIEVGEFILLFVSALRDAVIIHFAVGAVILRLPIVSATSSSSSPPSPTASATTSSAAGAARE